MKTNRHKARTGSLDSNVPGQQQMLLLSCKKERKKEKVVALHAKIGKEMEENYDWEDCRRLTMHSFLQLLSQQEGKSRSWCIQTAAVSNSECGGTATSLRLSAGSVSGATWFPPRPPRQVLEFLGRQGRVPGGDKPRVGL